MYINCVALGFLSFGFGIVGGFVLGFAERWWKMLGALLLSIGLSGMVWLIYAVNQPWEVDCVDYYDIKMVVFPDGSQQQMYTINGTHYNVTREFGRIAPEGWRVRRTTYNWLYCGVSFWTGENSVRRFNGYSLVSKEK